MPQASLQILRLGNHTKAVDEQISDFQRSQNSGLQNLPCHPGSTKQPNRSHQPWWRTWFQRTWSSNYIENKIKQENSILCFDPKVKRYDSKNKLNIHYTQRLWGKKNNQWLNTITLFWIWTSIYLGSSTQQVQKGCALGEVQRLKPAAECPKISSIKKETLIFLHRSYWGAEWVRSE